MRICVSLLFAVLPIFARSEGAPIGNTGAPGDGVCRNCHTSFPLNPDGGSIRIQTGSYKPGLPQNVKVTVSHPDAVRWGFQITARWAKDLSQTAGRFSPINTEVQPLGEGTYATHTSTGTLSGGSNGTKTFELNWTPPPGIDDGDIVFYAAGNAANNSGNNQGDRIYTTQSRIQADVPCGFTDRPAITKIIDSASGNLANAPRGLVTIQGQNFAPFGVLRVAMPGYIRDNRFPMEMGCVAVEIAGQRVPLLYLGREQINVQAPAMTESGDRPIRVIMNPDRPNQMVSESVSTPMQPFAPAFFTFNGRSVAALVPNGGAIVADPSVVPNARPARPGEIIELYGSGLGPTRTAVAPGTITPLEAIPINNRLTISIGGTTLTDADVLYAGLAPGNISGLYQINVRIPANTSNGDIPILMVIGSAQSVAGTTIPVRAQ
jgi:uncharacterized protein (TIGR03437 family)